MLKTFYYTNHNNNVWLKIRPDLNPLDYHVWGAMLRSIKPSNWNQEIRRSWRRCSRWYGLICHRSRSTVQCSSSRNDFRHMLQQMAVTLSISSCSWSSSNGPFQDHQIIKKKFWHSSIAFVLICDIIFVTKPDKVGFLVLLVKWR